ncbi:hypothetical protein [Cupriavidus oxalaticus]|jgi:hypothetical protein|uniref:Uncharacterized protein n=1 Tax=Cupriavidus oxalaticus TaxID=96344 RepID=A0A5P3VEN5_9BURK|nr:hypothetical protein [Cupriavidus oxalaticus]QEZ44864.1 hypothetical protein D2917_11920 [Cupriavidus oxalaticus]
MFAIACWLIFSVSVGFVANALGRSGVAWTAFSLILSPSLGLVFVAILDKKRTGSGISPQVAWH